MKKILIVNKFYYNRGGAEVVAIGMKRALQSKGYDVAVFTMQYDDNFNEENCFYASEVSFKKGFLDKIHFAQRTLGGYGVRSSFRKALKAFNPDIVHFHNIHSYLSPSIIEETKNFGCRVVWTLHDCKLLCPSYGCLRDNTPCELCFHDKFNVVKYRCMKGSLAASLLAYIEAKKWNRAWIERYVDAFVCPSSFIAGKMQQGGFDAKKLNVICNFVDPAKYEIFKLQNESEREESYLYVGRLSQEKGVKTLLEVASKLQYRLKVAGGGPLLDEFKEKYKDCKNIEFLGLQSASQVSDLMAKAKFAVIPSECYENNPLSVIESLCAGTPVIGANIGGIPELIDNNQSGLIFTSGNKQELKEAIENAFSKEWNNAEIKQKSMDRFSKEHHYDLLEKLYQ